VGIVDNCSNNEFGNFFRASLTLCLSYNLDESISNKLLQQAFSSLSLTDKCALSISIGQKIPLNSNSFDPRESQTLPVDLPLTDLKNNSIEKESDSDFDINIHSVLNTSDKESLNAAMAMMGDFELKQVEEEVSIFYSNF
jgi:hypothetical protein